MLRGNDSRPSGADLGCSCYRLRGGRLIADSQGSEIFALEAHGTFLKVLEVAWAVCAIAFIALVLLGLVFATPIASTPTRGFLNLEKGRGRLRSRVDPRGGLFSFPRSWGG